MKLDAKTDAKPGDEAFRIWVRNHPETGRIYKMADLKPDADGYGWYVLRATTPIEPNGFFIAQPGKAGALTLDKVHVAFVE